VRTSVSQSRLASWVFFLDRNLGSHIIVNALRQENVRVEIHDDHFLPDAHDEDWLTRAGQEEWVVLTKDDKIRYRPNERNALIQAGVRTFVIIAKNRSHPAVATMLVHALPQIYEFLENHPAPFIAKITGEGKVSMVLTK
jgi:hypothetical protein